MDHVIKELHETLEKGKKAVKDYAFKLRDVNEQKAILDRQEAKIKEVSSSLAEREFAVSKIENVVALKKQNDQDAAKIKEEREKLDSDKNDFVRYRDLEEARLSSTRDSIKKESVNIESNRKALEERMSKFDKEVEAKVNEILKKMGVKK